MGSDFWLWEEGKGGRGELEEDGKKIQTSILKVNKY